MIIAMSLVVYLIHLPPPTHTHTRRTEGRWHASMVIKRVTFECVDCFMPLFYIAFYQLDIITLRAEIASLFMSKRRVLNVTVYVATSC